MQGWHPETKKVVVHNVEMSLRICVKVSGVLLVYFRNVEISFKICVKVSHPRLPQSEMLILA